jgi:hypothetical protein
MKSLVALLTLSLATTAGAMCDRNPRELSYYGTPLDIFVSKDVAEVIFKHEGNLRGLRPDVTEGLDVHQSPIANKVGMTVTDDAYSSLVRVDAGSGKTYLLNLLSRPDCPDSLVTISLGEKEEQQAERYYTKNGKQHGLMTYLALGKRPKGYRVKNFKHVDQQDLLIFKQGSVEFYLQEQLIGKRYVGTTYRVVNRGRTPFRVDIENINYSNTQIKKSIGVAREVSMLPTSRRLGPAPEYVSQYFAAANEGLVFVVSEKPK